MKALIPLMFLVLLMAVVLGCSSGEGPDLEPPTGRVIVPTDTPAVVTLEPLVVGPLAEPSTLEPGTQDPGPVVATVEPGAAEPSTVVPVQTVAPVVSMTPVPLATVVGGPQVMEKPSKIADPLSSVNRSLRRGEIGAVPDVDVSSMTQSMPEGSIVVPPEAGGLQNPNVKLLPLVYFQGYGVNPFIDADEDALSPFSLDGDTASFEIGQLYLRGGALPEPDSVRVEEWVNSFDQGYGPVDSGLGLFLDGGPSPFGEEGYKLLRVGVAAADLPAEREPVSLVVVVDTSGSMNADNRIGVAKQLLTGILDGLLAGDRVALVEYGSTVNTRVPFTSAVNAGMVNSVVQELYPEGATYVEGGIGTAYSLLSTEGGAPAGLL